MKKKLTDLVKNAKDLAGQASKVGKEAIKGAGTVKSAVEVGVAASKAAVEKASQVMTKDKISQGLEVTSKGLDIAATGAKTIAKTMEKASHGVKKASDKIKNR